MGSEMCIRDRDQGDDPGPGFALGIGIQDDAGKPAQTGDFRGGQALGIVLEFEDGLAHAGIAGGELPYLFIIDVIDDPVAAVFVDEGEGTAVKRCLQALVAAGVLRLGGSSLMAGRKENEVRIT